MIRILLFFFLASCSSLKKDNEPKAPIQISEEVANQLSVYRSIISKDLDLYGLVRMGDSVGDSALFSCLARVSGATSFDPSVLFVDGKPIRHPDIKPGISKTPVSRDMVSGILWCLWDLHRKGETDHAKNLIESMISFGKNNPYTNEADLGWLFCSDLDRDVYQISDEDLVGRCFMTPSIIKDIYRIAKLVGVNCDATCEYYLAIGPNIPSDGTGFRRHLSVIATVRNGLVDGAINDNSLKLVLEKAAQSQPRNALYQSAFHLFGDGDQTAAFTALSDENLFPKFELPTAANYCTHYLFERDQDQKDWVPCVGTNEPDGRGIEWIFAATMALGELNVK